MEWYLNNLRECPSQAGFNEILLNVGYPSRKEKEFLKHVEQALQRKNDDKYRKILKQLEYQKLGTQDEGEEMKQRLLQAGGNNNNRQNGAQEDAQCVVCNSGDYEDEDMIVFCGLCNIPVH